MAKRKNRSPRREDKNSTKRLTTIVLVVIPIAALLAFGGTLGYDFTNWDDPELILENPHTTSMSPSAIADIFTPRVGQTYQPLRVLSYAIDRAIWQENAVGYRAVNVTLHTIAAMLLFLFLSRFLRQLRKSGDCLSADQATWAAALVAGLFLLHPVNVESVVWLASRKYGLLAAFGFASLYCHLRADSAKWHIAAVGLGLLAILSSPFGIVLAALILLLDYCRQEELDPRPMLKANWRVYAGHTAVALVFGILLMVVLTGGDSDVAKQHQGSLGYTILTVFRVLVDYSCNLVCPLWLNNRYFHDVSTSLLELKVILGLALTIATLVWVACELRKSNKAPLLVSTWFVIAWAPVSNIVVPISTIMADRYLYLAGIGPFLALGLLMLRLPTGPRKGALLALLLIFGGLTMQRSKVWKDSRTLWQDSIAKDDRNAVAHNGLGLVEDQAGRLDLAEQHFQDAVERDEACAECHFNLVRTLLQIPNLDASELLRALHHADAAIKWQPGYAEAYNQRGVLLGMLKRVEESEKAFARGIELAPELVELRVNLGNMRFTAGNREAALPAYQAALQLNPDLAAIHRNVAGILLSRPTPDRNTVLHHLSEALRVEPDHAPTRAMVERLSQEIER